MIHIGVLGLHLRLTVVQFLLVRRRIGRRIVR
jgi:hypothetical protein